MILFVRHQAGRVGVPTLPSTSSGSVGTFPMPNRRRARPEGGFGLSMLASSGSPRSWLLDATEGVPIRRSRRGARRLVSRSGRALWRVRLHEVVALIIDSGDREDIQHIVHVEFGQAVGQHGAGEVRVAMEVEVLTAEDVVHVGIASGAQQVVDAPAVVVGAIPFQGVVGERQQRAQIGQGRPQPVIACDVSALQLAGTRGPQAFCWLNRTIASHGT